MATGRDAESAITIPLQYNDSHWKAIFEKYDADSDGKISYQELKVMIRNSSIYTNDIPSRVIQMILHKADLDNSGFLEYPEFITMIHRKDMQGVFGHFVQRYIHSIVPCRPCAIGTLQTTRSGDFIDGLYEEEYTCNPPALAMIIISILEIILFLYDTVAHNAVAVEGPTATLFIYNPHKRYQAWRYLTYMFVHVGIFHLVVNLLVQVMLGIPLEMVHKWWRVLIIYFAGVVAGSLGTSVSDPVVYLAGASGVTSVDVGQAIYTRYVLETNNQIGYVAHLTGAIAGLLVGINILRNLEVRTWEKIIWWASFIAYTVLMAAAIFWNIFYPSYFPTPVYT
ncbi:PREDICTED: rhomboid-related protein 3 isoform X2 [Ceratosolen solmsi marchali]|uniref:Rhomboid-related protein 3 isoform X2 n=1 Tax=Ceratosolen solmsi marchali TaxID=326594 RepID=A0AAJ6YPI3_9HYME|nr:PREDICTED: rhomboid-related protein 3 isoform X2 [Ceratosolen solmsi marchali]